jgi:hypothetical protein
MKPATLEDCLHKIVDCPSGGRRRVSAVDKSHIWYAVEIGGGTWMELSATGRGYVEDDFLAGEIVDEINQAPILSTL